MDERIFGICLDRRERECMEPVEVQRPVWRHGRRKIANLCKHCRGPLRPLDSRELREYLEARANLSGGNA